MLRKSHQEPQILFGFTSQPPCSVNELSSCQLLWWLIDKLVVSQVKMWNVYWFQVLMCFFVAVDDSKWRVFGFWAVGWAKWASEEKAASVVSSDLQSHSWQTFYLLVFSWFFMELVVTKVPTELGKKAFKFLAPTAQSFEYHTTEISATMEKSFCCLCADVWTD